MNYSSTMTWDYGYDAPAKASTRERFRQATRDIEDGTLYSEAAKGHIGDAHRSIQAGRMVAASAQIAAAYDAERRERYAD